MGGADCGAGSMTALAKYLPGSNLPAAALFYVSKWRLCIFPVSPHDKPPALGGHGWHDATGNELQIKRWWAENPLYNIGIALPQSGLAVLDVDPRNGGDESLARLLDTYGALPKTYVVSTGGGGWHYYFRLDGQQYDLPKKVAPGIELLRNGYVIAPPSDTRNVKSGGGLYTVHDSNGGFDLQTLPVDWVERVVQGERFSRVESALPHDEDWTLGKGERNDMITKFMGLLRRYGFNAGELERWVRSWDTERVEDFEEMLPELATIAKSVARYEPEVITPHQISLTIRAREAKPSLDEDTALIGPIGEYVKYLAPDVEAHPAALLMQMLTVFGNCIGARDLGQPAPGFMQGETRHTTGLYLMLIGESGLGAKGDSWNYAKAYMKQVDPTWRYHEGVQTGEAFTKVLADDLPTGETSKIQGQAVEHVKKGGQRDRRYFDFEPEYSRVLKAAGRPGSTLIPILTALWDEGSTEKVVASDHDVVTGVTLSQVAHVTPSTLSRDFDPTELTTGYGGRFLYCWTERTKHRRREYPVDEQDLDWFVDQLQEPLQWAHANQDLIEYEFTDEAEALWDERTYQWKLDARFASEVMRALLSRARPQVMRLAVIYAVSTKSDVIGVRNLQAALAVFDYSLQTAEYVFGNTTGDQKADRLYRALLSAPAGLTRTQQVKVFSNHIKEPELNRITRLLTERGLVEEIPEKGKTKTTRVLIASTYRQDEQE